jgi:hypothetical protein
MDVGIGFVFCALVAILMSHEQHANHTPPPPHEDSSHLRSGSDSSSSSSSSSSKSHYYPQEPKLSSQYTKFQAMGFQIYTGGAPALLPQPGADSSSKDATVMMENPECDGLNSYGHFDDYDTTNETLPESLWQCYLGEEDHSVDVRRRLEIMTDAVERAYDQANHSDTILKIFVAPEFFFRGREGAYTFDVKETQKDRLDHRIDDECTEVCQIMKGLESLVSEKRFKDWLFLFGTVVVSETLPKEDAYEYLFYNFAPVYKGYDPDMDDHYGKRFLVPKRYVSNVDFLTPVRQYEGNLTKEIVALTQQQIAQARERQENQDSSSLSSLQVTPKEGDDEPEIVVQNPFELKRDFYDRDMWYAYKDELHDLGYTMIEYDWVILDNITFSIEVCLDHDARTALNAYMADNVMGNPTRIPKNVRHWDPIANKYVGRVEYVQIPRHLAQISLVSSMGMTANPESLALAENGTLILQDGMSSKTGTMAYTMDCDSKSWHFDGGSEFITRSTQFTDTRIGFQYQIHAPHKDVPVYQERDWKDVLKGVFTTTQYAPEITVYPIRHITKV